MSPVPIFVKRFVCGRCRGSLGRYQVILGERNSRIEERDVDTVMRIPVAMTSSSDGRVQDQWGLNYLKTEYAKRGSWKVKGDRKVQVFGCTGTIVEGLVYWWRCPDKGCGIVHRFGSVKIDRIVRDALAAGDSAILLPV